MRVVPSVATHRSLVEETNEGSVFSREVWHAATRHKLWGEVSRTLQGAQIFGVLLKGLPGSRDNTIATAHLHNWVTFQHPDAGAAVWEAVAPGSEICCSAGTDALQGNDGLLHRPRKG